jgi:predicted SprT family Zn-dependent metalloprotease
MTLTHPMDLYTVLRDLYDACNAEFFRDALPPCMIVLRARSKRTMGAFAPECWGAYQTTQDAHIDTLVLNSEAFPHRTEEEIVSTLVHEMCHVWQFRVQGKAITNGHHDKEWGQQMARLGLIPSATGHPGGRQTGKQVSHYVYEQGAFRAWFTARRAALTLDKPMIPLQETPKLIPRVKPPKKYKHVCPLHPTTKAWALDGMALQCGTCGSALLIDSATRQGQTDLEDLARQLGTQAGAVVDPIVVAEEVP